MKIRKLLAGSLVAFGMTASLASAQSAGMPGVTDTEILLGNTAPYSGPVSAYGIIAKTAAAYFEKINEQGGVNGRKIKLISYDDAYSPPRTVEQTRRLVERDGVAAIFMPIGTAPSSAIQKYLNSKKVPMLYVGGGAHKFDDIESFPWTMGWQPSFATEGSILSSYAVANVPDAKIGVLYQNDDFGKDLLEGVLLGLGDRADEVIVARASYETTDPTIDSQLSNLKVAGANVFIGLTSPKQTAQSIRGIAAMGWKPTQLYYQNAASVEQTLRPAGLENAEGVMTAVFLKDPADPSWADDPEMIEYLADTKKYMPGENAVDVLAAYGYACAATMVEVLRAAGDDLSRENIMRQALNMKDVAVPMVYSGIRLNNTATDTRPIRQMQMVRFSGGEFQPVGGLTGGR